MTGKIESRLAEMGLSLPTPAKPVASYVPFVQSGNLLFVSGQLPFGLDPLPTGTLTAADHADGAPAAGSRLAAAQAAARQCALNLIAQAKAATGDLDRITRVVKLGGFVNSDASFTQQPVVVNGASDLMQQVFGAAGEHARAAVGSSSLPMGVMVEIEAVFEIA
ncbi:RidA family protein [Limibaculum sp. M0105]|uniref:RidA family protein n=1 Tax=Thermohalobaculum xanthum TaxID=2753746 RepID=A0A8J7M7C1_9RHOB|nr:RidA family protein [Thermohalobaculum xanthum]MBK0399904.1 RidA family protein [Thermohalobaculum xanthum]